MHFVGNIPWLTSRLSINFYTHARQIVPFFWCKADKQRFDGFYQVSLYHVPGIRISLKYLLKVTKHPLVRVWYFKSQNGSHDWVNIDYYMLRAWYRFYSRVFNTISRTIWNVRQVLLFGRLFVTVTVAHKGHAAN